MLLDSRVAVQARVWRARWCHGAQGRPRHAPDGCQAVVRSGQRRRAHDSCEHHEDARLSAFLRRSIRKLTDFTFACVLRGLSTLPRASYLLCTSTTDTGKLGEASTSSLDNPTVVRSGPNQILYQVLENYRRSFACTTEISTHVTLRLY